MQPHEYVRNGVAKILTLFHPASGQVRVKGVTSSANIVLHPWLKEQLTEMRMLMIWDNLRGHYTIDMLLWLFQHGILPVFTPIGGSWLNMAESMQRILVQRALN